MITNGRALGRIEPTEDICDQPITIHCLNPLQDPRWSKFSWQNPNASVFHTVGWLRALRQTYGFEPIAFTTSGQAEEIKNALLFCSVRSWLTGSRLVSLPFSDHCEPLVENWEELKKLSRYVENMGIQEGRKYVEMRPITPGLESIGGFQKSSAFYLHRLDLRATLDALFHNFHKDCVQRKIRRAEREGLTYERGRTRSLVKIFYDLVKRTRQRHHVPPQPLQWFQNLIECMGGNACIRIAFKAGQPAAGILTLSHGKRVVYKYCGSDERLHKLGGVQMLLWRLIQESKEAGIEQLDFGRSDCNNEALLAFKDRWSAKRVSLAYWRSPGTAKYGLTDCWRIRLAKQLFARLPGGVLTLMGRFLYGHMD